MAFVRKIVNPLIQGDLVSYEGEKRYGLYTGYVEINVDPLQLNRLKVRVVSFNNEELKPEELVWAYPASGFGGGPGFGSSLVPPIGSLVWVMFMQGEEDYPVWMGSLLYNPKDPKVMLATSKGTVSPRPTNMNPTASPTGWTTNPGPGAPAEAVAGGPEPAVQVVYKSPKGASIVADERDGKESLTITDRGGATILMKNPVSRAGNMGNRASRGLRTSTEGNALPAEALEGRTGEIKIVDVGGQTLEFHSHRAAVASTDLTQAPWKGTIRLASKFPAANPLSVVTPGGQPESDGKNGSILELSGADGKIVIEVITDGERHTGIYLDGKNGLLNIETKYNITLDAPEVNITGNLTVDGHLKVNDSVHVDKNLTVKGFST